MFKTPGKLRGKTPRTVRKRNPLEPRQVCAVLCVELLTSADIRSHFRIYSQQHQELPEAHCDKYIKNDRLRDSKSQKM
jgi:hypothetical protein